MKVILFDLDGVLVDACDFHYKALNHALLELGYPEISKEKHLDVFNGLPTKTKLKLMRIPEDKSVVIDELKQKYTIEFIKKDVQRDEDKISLLKELRKSGLQIGCVTNCSPSTAGLMLSRSGLLRYISIVVTNADVVNPKPSPEGYSLAMTRMQVAAKDVMIVEDSPKGVAAAKASGAKIVLSVKGPQEVTFKLIMGYIL